jgi:hypothetical protein
MSIFLAILIILALIALRFGLPLALSVAAGFIMCRLADWLEQKDQQQEGQKEGQPSSEN